MGGYTMKWRLFGLFANQVGQTHCCAFFLGIEDWVCNIEEWLLVYSTLVLCAVYDGIGKGAIFVFIFIITFCHLNYNLKPVDGFS